MIRYVLDHFGSLIWICWIWSKLFKVKKIFSHVPLPSLRWFEVFGYEWRGPYLMILCSFGWYTGLFSKTQTLEASSIVYVQLALSISHFAEKHVHLKVMVAWFMASFCHGLRVILFFPMTTAKILLYDPFWPCGSGYTLSVLAVPKMRSHRELFLMSIRTVWHLLVNLQILDCAWRAWRHPRPRCTKNEAESHDRCRLGNQELLPPRLAAVFGNSSVRCWWAEHGRLEEEQFGWLRSFDI